MANSRNKPLANQPLKDILQARLAKDVPADAHLCVALSGGRDSVVLLNLLAQCLPPQQIQVVHVHHGLSPNADAWADFCQSLAAAYGLSIDIHRVKVDKTTGKGLEAAARSARWDVFSQYPSSVLALAHHQDDQAETVLFRLLRGTGVQGLAGMATLQTRQGQKIWRPLLDSSKQKLAAYAAAQSLSWIEDESNRDTHYARNFLRHDVFPGLLQRFPSAPNTISRLAEHAAEASILLDERAREDLAALAASANDDSAIELCAFLMLSTARQRNVLRYWLRQAGWQAPENHTLDEWLAQLGATKSHHQTRLSYSQGECRVWRGRVYRVPLLR
jgi:tRNA(Ile)-lysidine synthase